MKLEDYNDDIFNWIQIDEVKLVSFAQEYIGHLYFKERITIDSILEQYNSVEKAKVLLSLPFEAKIFEMLKKQDEEAQEYYWQNNNAYFRVEVEEKMHIEWILKQFRKYKRPMRAIDCFSNVLYMQKKGLVVEIDLDLIYEMLIQIATEENGENIQHNDISKAIKHFLKNSDEVEKKKTLEWIYINFDDIKPLAIEKIIASSPKDFVELISYIYKPSSSAREDEGYTLEQIKFRADHAYKVVEKMQLIPGQDEKDNIDAEHLKKWVTEAQEMFIETDRVAIGEQCIGQLLAKSPNGTDDIWPHEAIREVFEDCLTDEISTGFLIGKRNLRGVVWRGSGGEQEYALSKRYRDDAEKIKFTYPNTFQLLSKLANEYEEKI